LADIKRLEDEIESTTWEEDMDKIVYKFALDKATRAPLAPNYIRIQHEPEIKVRIPALGRSKYRDEMTLAYNRGSFEETYRCLVNDEEIELIKTSKNFKNYLKHTKFELFSKDDYPILNKIGFDYFRQILLNINSDANEYIDEKLDTEHCNPKDDPLLFELMESANGRYVEFTYGDWDDDPVLDETVYPKFFIFVPIPKEYFQD